MNTPLFLVGDVHHRRTRPRAHAFHYRTYMLRWPLRTWSALPVSHQRRTGNRWCSYNGFNLLSFHPRDHGDGTTPLIPWIDALLHAAGLHDADGEVWLHTFPRVLGHAFKPVSFWFCHRADGALRAVLAEVNSTFGERHHYLLSNGAAGAPLKNGEPLSAVKSFHVSPFAQVAGDYRFEFFTTPATQKHALSTLARVVLHDEQGPLLITQVSGQARAFTAFQAFRLWCTFPMMSWGVVLHIHVQALRLWLKRVPFWSKPPAPVSPVTHGGPVPASKPELCRRQGPRPPSS